MKMVTRMMMMIIIIVIIIIITIMFLDSDGTYFVCLILKYNNQDYTLKIISRGNNIKRLSVPPPEL